MVSVTAACIVPSLLEGQSFALSSQRVLADTVSLGFERVLNTFMWNGILGFCFADSNNAVDVHQTLQSKLIRTVPVATQGQYDGYVRYRGRVEGNWAMLARTASLVVSDNQSIDLSRLAQHQGLLGVGYKSDFWNMDALGGYEVDAQQDTHDQGPVFDVSVEGHDLNFQQIEASFQSDWTKSFLGQRTPEQRIAVLALRRDFGGGDSDSLVARYGGQRREFYTAADPGLETLYSIDRNIFRRDAVNFDISNRLTYHMGQRTAVMIRGSVQNRTIDRSFLYKDFLQPSSITLDTRIQEFLLDGSASLASRVFDWLQGEVGMSFQERDERFSVNNQAGVPSTVFRSQQESAKRLEYTSQRTSVWGTFNSDFSDSDRLTINGSASILRYDTPDSMNTDDRDELLIALAVGETHDFNPYLSVGVEANATLNHLVYLDRLQSANNNWNRVISFSPRVSLRPTSWLSSDNVARVIANYTVYDFEEQVASVKSFSFRQAEWSDSTMIDVSRRMSIGFAGVLRVYERGILKWKEFTEKPLDYFVEQSLWPQVIYRMSRTVAVSAGYRFFSRDQYAYDGTAKVLQHTLTTAGPTASVTWYGAGGTNVVVRGWRETSAADSGQSTYVSNLSVAVNLMF